MIQTLVFNAQVPVLMGASMFYMTPNSPIAKPFGEMSEENVFKSRLTAMAWETDNFKREDIYTLFITTRILNFLKGLNVGSGLCEAGIDPDALQTTLGLAKQKGGRDLLGAEILEKLLAGEGLFAATNQGFQPVLKFKTELFFKIWNQLEYVTTQAGRRIRVELEKSVT
jgi:hypothetical protein